MIGTNLDPEKNPSTGGNSIVWNLLYKNATNSPTVIPPNTEVTIDWIPTLVPITDDGTSLQNKMSNVPSAFAQMKFDCVALNTNQPTNPENTATPASSENAITTPRQNSVGKLPKIMSPMFESVWKKNVA